MRIGVDLGGTKIEAVALDDDNRERGRRRVPTPRDDYAGTIETIAGLVEGLERELDLEASVGVGTPGAVSPATGLMKNCNSVWLNGRPLAADLERRLGRPVRLANDANCFALSEAAGRRGGRRPRGLRRHPRHRDRRGPGRGRTDPDGPERHRRGVGPQPAAVAARRRVAGAARAIAGGPGASRRSSPARGSRGTTAGPPTTSPPAPPRGEPAADASLARYEERMARALASVINVVDPDVIVLGGGLSSLARLYERVPRLWSRWVFSDRVDTRLVPPAHGDASGVRGAAWLWEGPSC